MSELKKRQLENLHHVISPLKNNLLTPEVTDLWINPDEKCFIKKFKQAPEYVGIISSHVTQQIINCACYLMEIEVSPENDLYGSLPGYNCRFQAFVRPSVIAPSLILRKKNDKITPFLTYLDQERLTVNQYQFIVNEIRMHHNILIGGATNSGKTHLLNSLLATVAEETPYDRLFIVEDTDEIHCSANDYLQVCVPPHKTAGELKKALRSNPNRIIFGELRFGETAIELLTGWNTGHPGGLSTIHANQAVTMLNRVEELLQKSENIFSKEKIAQTINCVLHMENKIAKGPVVSALLKVELDQAGQYKYTNII